MTGTGQPPAAPAIDIVALPDLFSSIEAFDGLVVAVSGGADSMALMHLLADWRANVASGGSHLPDMIVATVDHGLRTEAKEEAIFVAERAASLGLIHETVYWTGEKPATGLQDAARVARYRLLEEIAKKHWSTGRVAIVTAHTLDDQVETFLMRLARGSGLEGLTGMDASRRLGPLTDVALLRPFLRLPKAALIATLNERGQSWLEDPSNSDERFERVRWRRARHALEDLGLTNEMIAKSIVRLRRADMALDSRVNVLAQAASLDLHRGLFAQFDAGVFGAEFGELRVRFLSRLLRAYGGQLLPPRLVKIEALSERLAAHIAAGEPTRQTLGGCVIHQRRGVISIMREPARHPLPEIELNSETAAVWDHRFRVSRPPSAKGAIVVRALGQDAKALIAAAPRVIEDSNHDAVNVDVAATLPGFWRDGHLVSVPLLDGLLPNEAGSEAFDTQFVFSNLFTQHADAGT